jgi:hypothetical protein
VSALAVLAVARGSRKRKRMTMAMMTGRLTDTRRRMRYGVRGCGEVLDASGTV